jgi:hypothetical protein
VSLFVEHLKNTLISTPISGTGHTRDESLSS